MSLRGSAVFAVTFGTPSTRKFVEAVPIAAPTDAFGRFTRAVSCPVAGTSSVRFTTDRSCTGSTEICTCVTTAPTSVLVVSTTGASPVTVTDSWSVCTPIRMSFGYSRPIVRTMSFTSTVPKPWSSAFSS